MREILFRGKREDNREWVEGSLSLEYGEATQDGNRKVDYRILGMRCDCDYVIPETVGQYTGLTDKKGKKIFEGDIVKDHESGLYSEVVFATAQDGFDGMSGFMVDDINDGLQNYNGFWHLVEIIGNIHDNPELLKEAEQE